ncbi:HK97 family phage portal protein [Rubricella aquisinus]|uniref:HK97 family phage portal protein n=1 Tax=Rubricella aquisinus TaxID=2028108 RepID=A0A840WN97_9RHOB|nr:phage portal protein [Rubricella aquisinus]MBB5516529.1 HK97 family phage portal protein [Rubricella aquisinus]
MVLELFKRAPVRAPEAKAHANRPVIAFHGSGRAAWTARDTPSLVRAGFAGNPVGFRCVKLIAEAASAVPFALQDGARRYADHPILSLLARPNGAQGTTDLMENLIGQFLLSGDAFLEAVGEGQDGLPAELHVLRSDRVRVVPGATGWPIAFEYSVGAKKHRLKVDSICHIKAFHPQDDHYGLSAMQSAASAVDVHNAASRWSKSLLDNAARPSGALVYRGTDGLGGLTDDQFDRLRGELEGYHSGAVNAGRPMLLEGGLDWKPMGFSPSDMEFQKTKESAAREIALAFGVPPMLLGLPGDNSYANYQEANRAFYRLTVLPLLSKVSDAMSCWFHAMSGTEAVLKTDLDAIPALATEREAQWRRVASADFLSEDEKRSLLGLPPRVDP